MAGTDPQSASRRRKYISIVHTTYRESTRLLLSVSCGGGWMSLDSTLVYYSCNQDFFFSLVLSRATTDSGGHTKTMARRRRLLATIAKGQPNNFRYFDKKTGNGLVRNFHGQRGDCEKKGKIQVPPSFLLLLLALQNDLAIYQHWQQQLSQNNVVPC